MAKKQDANTVQTIVIQMEGGVINCVNADGPVRVIFIDSDTESGDMENVMAVNGGEAYVSDYVLTEPAESNNDGISDGIEPGFVKYIVGQVDAEDGAHG